MRVLRVTLLAMLVGGATVALAPDAGAASNAKACATYENLNEDLADATSSGSASSALDVTEEVGDAFHKAAKTAPKQVKSSLKTIGDYYDAVSDADSVTDVRTTAKLGSKYAKAIIKFGAYIATNCS